MSRESDETAPCHVPGLGGALLRSVVTTIDVLCYAGASLAALATAGMAVMLIVEVFSVSLFGWSQPWVVEYSGYMLAAILFAGSGWTLKDGGHIRVNVLFSAATDRHQRLLDLMATVWGLGFIGFAAWAMYRYAIRSAEVGSLSTYRSETPLVYPQLMLAISVTLLWLALLARFLRLIAGLQPERPAVEGEIRE
ncbi:TRAP transporter small permease (plasmid) [Sulfitobacter sp. LCG007]